MREYQQVLIGAIRQQYLLSVASLKGTAGVHEAFAYWILGPRHQAIFDPKAITQSAMSATGAARTYKEVAVLGYAASTTEDLSPLQGPLGDGLNWLIGRKPFTQEPSSFEVDGTALLGIALGAKALESDTVMKWLLQFLPTSVKKRLPPMERCLATAAASVAASPGSVTNLPEIELADMRVALASRGVPIPTHPEDPERALHLVLEESEVADDAIRSAARIRVLDWLLHETSLLARQQLTAQDVHHLLEQVSFSLKRWRWDDKTRWDIRDEYHVQDLLWAILAPLFPDLDDEEYLPSVGHKHPRCDLGIPSLHVVVEVKFLRKGTQGDLARIIEEIAADHSLYTTAGSLYDKIIAFIWDDSCSTEQHGELKQGLSKMPGIVGTVIVSRPAKMTKE